MSDSAHSEQRPAQSYGTRVHRARSLPSARPFRITIFFASIHYLALITTATVLICFITEPNQASMLFLVGGVIFSAISWLIAFFRRRETFCPLCKGTPLVNSGARTHLRARKIPPFNHGVSATLSILANQRFRCMYCGSDFDLLKPPTRLHHGTNK